MSTKSPKPVLIVGAGPTGMVLASELARRRIPVRLIDRKPAPTETSRSFTLHARTMEMFEHIGLAHRFLEDGLKSRGFYFTFKGKQEHPTLDFRGLPTRYPYVLVYNQNETERRLREHLDAMYDIRPQWGTALTELSFDGGTFTAKLVVAGDDGREEILHPEWTIGCDGIHSFVRKAMGLEFEGENYEDMVMQMMDVRYRNFPGADEWVHYFMSKDNFLLVTRLPDGNHRVLISDTGEADDAELSPRRAFQRLIDGHLDATTLDEPEWATKWTIWKRLATDYRSGNALLAGDAAHVHSPSGGQGMNIGMQDAFNLGWKLAMVISGRAKPALLDTYAPERQPIGAQAIAGTDAMHDIIMAHGHGMEDRLELTRRSGWHDETVERISGLSYTYRDADGGLRAGEPVGGLAPGDRAPDARLSKRLRLFDLLRHPGLTLLLVAPRAGDDGRKCERIVGEVDRRFASVIRSFVIGAETVAGIDAAQCIADETGEFAAAYGAPSSGWIYLVRPDGYVAFGGSLAAPKTLLEYLGQWFEEVGS